MRDNLPLDELVALLRASVKGSRGGEAATELLVRYDRWLGRRDFRANCIDAEHDLDTGRWFVRIEWDNVGGFLEDAVFSSSEGRVLRLAAELAGVDSGLPLAELLGGLDNHNSRLVIDAIAHTLGQWVAQDRAGDSSADGVGEAGS
jgi:hypothetical protein